MRRRWCDGVAALSLVLALATGVLWLKHALRREFHFGGAVGIVGGANDVPPSFPAFKLVARDGFEWTTLHARERSYGPAYLTPEFVRWEKPLRSRDRSAEFLGFRYAYWADVSYSGGPSRPAVTWFSGYERDVAIPYWFALACFGLPPAWWLRAWRRRRRRQRHGQCLACGYDLRATPERCPECGAVPAGVGRGDGRIRVDRPG